MALQQQVGDDASALSFTAADAPGYERVEFVHNDPDGNMLTVLEDCLQHCRSFKFAVAFITFSGLAVLREALAQLRARGISGRILTTDYMYVTDPRALTEIAQQFENIDLRIYITTPHDRPPPLGGFHAKGYIFEYEDEYGLYNIIIGSSNLTARALKVNQEWNTRITLGCKHKLVSEVLTAYDELWNSANVGRYQEYIDDYTKKYAEYKRERQALDQSAQTGGTPLRPNAMQQDFIDELERLLRRGERRALLISATGTGKTYAAAFAVRELLSCDQRVLFIVHREQIARQARRSFERILGGDVAMGYLTGNQRDSDGARIIFATMQTISKPEVMGLFPSDAFHTIIIDEAHHVGAASYQRITGYFKPHLWLGMSASPDRMDDFDVYAAFDHNIVCEIRLQHALEYGMLCPFHYYGITEFWVREGQEAKLGDFRYLISEKRIKYILEKIKFYSYSGDKVHGLIFCSRNDEAAELSRQINALSEFRAVHLSGENTQAEREMAIARLESSDSAESLDYIITVDIFNEGVDIPCVNQVVMLRPTQSPVVFVQQLGRGLRRHADKTCVVIIDFIGNYDNNYMIPMALSGDRSYDKENLRRYVLQGAHIIPGASTVNFDPIATRRIIESIDTANFSQIRVLCENYRNLKNKLGRIPCLQDFDDHGSMAVECIFRHKQLRSYHGFLSKYEDDYQVKFDDRECNFIAFISQQLANGRRNDDLIIVQEILRGTSGDLYAALEARLDLQLSEARRRYLHNFLSNSFMQGTGKHAYPEVSLVRLQNGKLEAEPRFVALLDRSDFRSQVEELVAYGLRRFQQRYAARSGGHYLVLNEKYSYFDVCRCLSWEHQQPPQNIGGYFHDKATRTMPIFVNYTKGEETHASIRYDDRFVDRKTMSWVSKNKRNLKSPDIQTILNCRQQSVDLHLFVRRNNVRFTGDTKTAAAETFREFYYLGEVTPDPGVEPQTISIHDEERHQDLAAVRLQLQLQHPVRADIYDYLSKR